MSHGCQRHLARCCLSALLAVATASVLAAEPLVEPLLKSSADGLGQPLHYPDGSAAELTMARVTLQSGDSTGWHFHPVPVTGYLLSGELTVDYDTGERRVFSAGTALVEALGTAHNGRNLGTEPVVILAWFAGAPAVTVTQAAEPFRPADIIDVRGLIPELQVDLRYRGSNNFVGRRIDGYDDEVVLLTQAAARALQAVQQELAAAGLGLKVFDAYRPQRAVDDFVRWTQDAGDTANKAAYYPALDKASLVPQGYIAARSGHSRGSTIDVTLVQLDSGEELDMGGSYDLFDPSSSPQSTAVGAAQRANRLRLQEVMRKHGFVPLEQEWWHFTLADEPWPERYFDFPLRQSAAD